MLGYRGKASLSICRGFPGRNNSNGSTGSVHYALAVELFSLVNGCSACMRAAMARGGAVGRRSLPPTRMEAARAPRTTRFSS